MSSAAKSKIISFIRAIELIAIYLFTSYFVSIILEYFVQDRFLTTLVPRVVGLGATIYACILLEKISLSDIGISRKKKLSSWLKGFVIAASGILVTIVIYGFLNNQDINFVKPAISLLVLSFIYIIIQSASEELIFRGLVLEVLKRKWGMGYSIILSSLLFSLFHVINNGFSPVFLVSMFLFGVFCAIYKFRNDKGGLWGVFGFHAGWNFIQAQVFMNVTGLNSSILIWVLLVVLLVVVAGLRTVKIWEIHK